MTVYRVTLGFPFPGHVDFTDYARAVEFATTAHTEERATITHLPPAATEEI